MCAVSYVGDYWHNSFPQRWPNVPMQPVVVPMNPQLGEVSPYQWHVTVPQISREEFDALRKEVQELKELLLAAKKFDEATGQPDCHMDEKVEMIRKIAIMVGVDMKDIFPDNAN